MAGGGDVEDNPVSMNVVAMVDIIFCLCVFFMCSFKFKQLEGKFDSWLPKGKGATGSVQIEGILDEVRVAMFWDADAQRTVRQLGTRRVDDDKDAKVVRQYGTRYIKTDEELETLIRGANDDFKKLNKDVPVIIDGDARIPWEEVMIIVNIAKRLGIEKIQFALGANAPTTN